MVTPSPAVFFRHSLPPLPATALRSHTLSTPVTEATKSEEENSPGVCRSCWAE